MFEMLQYWEGISLLDMQLSETVENTGVDVKKLLALICILFRPEPIRNLTHCTGVETREKLKNRSW